MNRDLAWAAVHDPATDGGSLAAIAQQYPEFAEAIERHPNCYPELRQWLADYMAAPLVAGEAAGDLSAVANAPDSDTVPEPVAAAPRATGGTRSRRPLVISAIAAGAVLLIGGGAWAAMALGGGPGPSAGSKAGESPAAPPTTIPIVCPTMAAESANSSGNSGAATTAPVQAAIGSTTSRAEVIPILTSISSKGSDVAKKIDALPASILGGQDATRAIMFSAPKSADALRGIDRRLSGECGGRLVADLDALIAQVPTKSGNRITHTDDTLGLCGKDAVTSLGWTGSVQVFSCATDAPRETTLIALDYTKKTFSTRSLSIAGDAKNATPVNPRVSGGRVVWTQTTEKPQEGLTQPLFTGTLYSWDPGGTIEKAEVFTDLPAAATPEFLVLAAGEGFAVVGGWPTAIYPNSATAPRVLYDVRGSAPKKIDLALPPLSENTSSTLPRGMDVGLLPLWYTPSNRGAYLDTREGAAISGLVLDESLDDGGCDRIAIATDFAQPTEYNHAAGTWTDHHVLVAQAPSGLMGGRFSSVRTSSSMSLSGVSPVGLLFSDDAGISSLGYDGVTRWTIPSTVATMRGRLLNRIVMMNASGQTVIVDEATGKEVADAKDEIAQLLRSAADATDSRVISDDLLSSRAGDKLIVTAQTGADVEGQVALVLDQDATCPSVDVPTASTPLDQLFPG